MKTTAIIPRSQRISAIMPSAPDANGYTFQLATAEDYRRYAIQNPGGDKPHPNGRVQATIENHGVAVLMEVFDTIEVGIPFNAMDLIHQLSTIGQYAPKTQHCILSDVFRWAAMQDDPQIRKQGGKWVLTYGETPARNAV